MFVIGCVLILNGILFNLFAFKNISVSEFIGLTSHTEVSGKLIQKGIYTFVRHPIYTGVISLFMGVFLYQPTLYNALNFGGIIIYLPIGIYLEEQKLIELYGSAYLDYRKKVKAVIPFLI
jgi:protein-S-isoprenylcysteine O-methyltransferase Ste14